MRLTLTGTAAWTRALIPASMLFLSAAVALAASPSDTASVDALKRTGKAFTAVAKQAIPAVVFIQVEKTLTMRGYQAAPFNDPFEFFGDDFLERFFGAQFPRYRRPREMQRLMVGQGTGFLISRDGYILSNNHIVGDADKITVRLHDGREFQAKRIGADPLSEVAVIKIEGDDLPHLDLGDSDALDIGEWVIAVGNPFGLSETLTVGVVSAKGRQLDGVGYTDFIQTDAAINPGNSGGPLLNIEGKVVGINTAIYTQTGGSIGIGFAIPINMARTVKDQIVKTGKVRRGQIGILMQPVTREIASYFGLKKAEGILVSDVVRASPAEKAGVKHGDIITRLNGKPVDDLSTFRNQIAMTPPGTTIDLAVMREKNTKVLRVKVGELGAEGEEASAPPSPAEPLAIADRIGIAVDAIPENAAQRLGYDPGEGVLVTEVREGSPAARAGIEPGNIISNVNGKPVKTVQDFNKALAESEKNKSAMFVVKQGKYSKYIALTLE